MLKWFFHNRIAAFERAYGYDASYLHDMADISPRAFRRFGGFQAMSQHREDVPPAVWFAVRLVATMSEDCGPCAQLGVDMATQAGVSPVQLRALVAGDVAAMDEEIALAWHYARTVLAHDPEADLWRERIEARWGRRAVVSLAMGMASVRVYPLLKYALGHGKACTRLRVGDSETAVARALLVGTAA